MFDPHINCNCIIEKYWGINRNFRGIFLGNIKPNVTLKAKFQVKIFLPKINDKFYIFTVILFNKSKDNYLCIL